MFRNLRFSNKIINYCIGRHINVLIQKNIILNKKKYNFCSDTIIKRNLLEQQQHSYDNVNVIDDAADDNEPNVDEDFCCDDPNKAKLYMRKERKKLAPNRLTMVKHFCKVFNCTPEHANDLLKNDSRFYKLNLNDINKSIEILSKHKIMLTTIFDNSWILLIPPNRLRRKMEILDTFKLNNIYDFLPFLKVTLNQLRYIQQIIFKENIFIPEGNRVYHMSNKLMIDANIVSSHFVTHLFMFNMPFDTLSIILQLLLKYHVLPINILRDLWVFRYAPQSIEKRLEKAKIAQKDKIMPWMVRCPEFVLEHSIKLNKEKHIALGNNATLSEYLSKHLNIDIDTATFIIDKNPSILKVRIAKINEVLDYLLNEAELTPLHIIQVPRIFSHSLETTKLRIKELKSHGCVPSTLIIVCKSKNEYEKFLKNWIIIRKKREEFLKKEQSVDVL